MSASGSSTAADLVMVLLGAWLLLQTLVGGLAARIAGLTGSSNTPNPGSPAVQKVGQVGGKTPTFNPTTGKSVPGTGTAPGAGTGSGGTGYGTGAAPGYQPPGGLYKT